MYTKPNKYSNSETLKPHHCLWPHSEGALQDPPGKERHQRGKKGLQGPLTLHLCQPWGIHGVPFVLTASAQITVFAFQYLLTEGVRCTPRYMITMADDSVHLVFLKTLVGFFCSFIKVRTSSLSPCVGSTLTYENVFRV